MGIPVRIAGLDRFVTEVPDGRVVTIEGGMGASKSYLAVHLALTGLAEDRPATYVTTQTRSGIETLAERIGGADGLDIVEAHEWTDIGVPAHGERDLFLDAFSYVALGSGPAQVAEMMRQLRAYARASGRVVVLTTERGMLPPQSATVTEHLSDAVIQLHARDDPDSVVHYLRIPKWLTEAPTDQNVFYSFDGRHLLIDTRKRVL